MGLEAGTSVEGIFFEGGYGRGYIDNAADIFRALHPDNSMSVEGIQRVGEQLRPRFIGGNPPDVIDNSGAGNLDGPALVAEGELLDLAPLFAAPSLDTPGKTFGETLFPGSQDTGKFDGVQYYLNIGYTVSGIWYSKTLFDDKGWTYPTTWDEMLSFCEMVKTETDMAPWTYQGKYPAVHGLWRAHAAGLQARWLAGDHRPGQSGRRLRSPAPPWKPHSTRFRRSTPTSTSCKGPRASPTPRRRPNGSKGTRSLFRAAPGWKTRCATSRRKTSTWSSRRSRVRKTPAPLTRFLPGRVNRTIVPANGANSTGGLEFLRCMMSKENAKYFAKNVSAIMPVTGGTEGVELSPAMISATSIAEKSGDATFDYRWKDWYRDEPTKPATAPATCSPGASSRQSGWTPWKPRPPRSRPTRISPSTRAPKRRAAAAVPLTQSTG